MSQTAYSNPQPLSVLFQMLQRSTTSPWHQLWADDLSMLDTAVFQHTHVHSPKQLTDVYLLGLAVKNQGCLVSFDQRIPLSSVHRARSEHLIVL